MNKKYRKLFYFTVLIVVACVIASSVITALTAPYEGENTPKQVVSEKNAQRVYVLTQRYGMVTAYIRGVEVPYIETKTQVNSLPFDIQRRLREGIEFHSEEELRRVMDEYCS